MLRTPWLLALAVLLFSPVLLTAQESYTIKIKVGGKGTVTTVTEEGVDEIRTVIKLQDGKEIKKNESEKKQIKFNEEILDQEGDDAPTKLRRNYENASTTTTADGKTSVKEEPYHRKTLVVERKDGKPVISVDGDALPEKSLPAGMMREFSRKNSPTKEMELLIPKKAIAVGATWKLDSDAIWRLVGGGNDDRVVADIDKATAAGKLVKAYKKDGKQFGVIQYDATIPIVKLGGLECKPGFQVTASITMDVCIDGSADRNVTKSAFSMKGEASGMGITVQFDVSGTVTETRLEAKK